MKIGRMIMGCSLALFMGISGVQRASATVAAVAKDGLGNTIPPTEYIDTNDVCWRVHIFTTNGTFEVTQAGEIEYLVVGGGGGGGRQRGGGGGAGGFLANVGGTRHPVTAKTYPIVVGEGGSGATDALASQNGSNSVFDSFIAVGGGAGGNPAQPNTGGSGGGAYDAHPRTGADGTSGQGHKGGDTVSGGSGGGGGGASTDGLDSTGLNVAGDGGAGLSSLITGTETYYGGGGGGGSEGGTAGGGGSGGGGDGSVGAAVPKAGAANTGGGGGAAGRAPGNSPPGADGADGGSGIVVIRYVVPAPTRWAAAVARDALGNVIPSKEYLDTNGLSWIAHIFTNSGTLEVTKSGNVEVLVVGGGGGGGRQRGGGGGAGGFLTNVSGTRHPVTAKTYPILVGEGGSGTTDALASQNGSNSVFDIFIAVGGGGGGTGFPATRPKTGGSGGGTSDEAASVGKTGADGTEGQGHKGGDVSAGAGRAGAGGGGAEADGGDTTSLTVGGAGGNGKPSSITGAQKHYAGGGGGGSQGGTAGAGGTGGGGSGSNDETLPTAGSAATGGGGGGGGRNGGTGLAADGADGGSGIVVVRYGPPTGTLIMLR